MNINTRLSNKEIINLYVESTQFGFLFRFVFISILLSYSILNFYKLFTFGTPSPGASFLIKLLVVPTIPIVGVGLIKHFLAVYGDTRLSSLLWNPFLSVLCIFHAIKPSEEDIKLFRYIKILYYLSIVLLILFLISIAIFVIVMFTHANSN
jgi:hypothetical protein